MKVIKYFTASWCSPCRVFKPIMEELMSEGVNVQIIDVDENHEEAELFQVRSVPTCIILKDSKTVDRWTGTLPKESVKKRYIAVN